MAIIWDKGFVKEEAIEKEPIKAPFSVEGDFETVTVEIEDAPKPSWMGKGFGSK